MDRPEWLIEEKEDVYHACSKSGRCVSSHMLADFRKSPRLYKRKIAGLVPERDSSAFGFGRAAHTLILEGEEAFKRRFAVGGPVNPKTGNSYGSATRAYREWLAESGMEQAVTHDEKVLLEIMRGAVMENGHAASLLGDGWAEGVVRVGYCGNTCQARLDWLSSRMDICDLKTCEDLDKFELDARRYGYANQMAFYGAVFGMASGCNAYGVWLIAVEKKEPYRCGVWRMSDKVMERARMQNTAALFDLARCQNDNEWQTGYEAVRTFECR